MNTRKRFLSIAVSLFALVTLTTGIAGCTTDMNVDPNPSTSTTSNALSYTPSQPTALYDEAVVTSLYDKAIPAVVEIQTVTEESQTSMGPFQFDVPSQRGIGSGFFIDDQGYIITNNHVVENTSRVTVTVHNGEPIEATVIGTDPQNDLALIKIDTNKLESFTYLPMGDSENIRPGQMAIAMGSPYGLEGSITVGVVSGMGRSLPGNANIRTIVNVIQTDAAINPGNSGGPLFNSSGEVIGINTAIESSGSNIGYAIAINTVKTRLPLLREGGKVKTPWLGITGMEIDTELVKEIGLEVDKGVYVISVTAGSPADEAGLIGSGSNGQGIPNSGGDVIIAIDDLETEKTEDIIGYLNGRLPGDTVMLSVIRGNETISLPVTLGEWPDEITP
jgi:S1-C subfamily serine protease